MTSPFQRLAQEEYSQNPEPGMKNPYHSPFEQLANSEENKETFGKSASRTAAQIPQGLLEATTPGIAAALWQLLSQGEILDPEELDRLKLKSEQLGIPFDEEKYMESAQQALGTIPTVSNIAAAIEEKTGIPLKAKTGLQKVVRLGSNAAGFTPGSVGQKAVAGVVAPTTAAVLEKAGVPEPFAELIGLATGNIAGVKAPKIDIGKARKPSGLTERGFENVKTPREVSEKKIGKINQALESDFKDISDKIIKESPIGETADNLKNDPVFKHTSRDLLDEAQKIADTIPELIPSKSIKKEIADITSKNPKGFALNDYEKSYLKFMKEAIEDILPENITHGELVKQYRKNNKGLTEYFKPGESKAYNNAKRDALLDQNKAISKVLEKTDPELSEVFKEGNSRWTKIMDTEAVDSFIGEVFKEGINYKKLHDWFDKTGYDRIFKRALGEEGFKSFETLMKDMLTSEAPYKMLKVAKSKGWDELFKTGLGYVIKPVIGQTKLAIDLTKGTYKALMNSMLEKPKLAITWKKAVEDLKKGDFKASEKGFKTLEGEIQETSKEPSKFKETAKKIVEDKRKRSD